MMGSKMKKRFFTPPDKQSFFLFGPRGTGKSTWLKAHYADAYWIDLLKPEIYRLFSTHPERLEKILDERPEQKVVVIDEIQKVPDLLNVVHRMIEEKRGYQFILTGSSARKLKREGVNLLAGRAFLKYLAPFFAAELGSDFNLAQNMKLGMLPLVLDSSQPQEVLRAYVGIYLKEEVQNEGIVRNVGDFARFLETMSFSHAAVINASTISRDCQVARKTVDNFLQILEDLLLAFRLDVFRHKAKRELSSHQKFYYFDAGVYQSLRPQNLYGVETEKEGAALEGLVAQHLKAWAMAQRENYQLHFWRTQSKVEVDFIVTGPDCFLALEVKNGTTVHPADFRGLHTFVADYPSAKPILLYRGKERFKEKDILCYPVDEFLLSIKPDSRMDLIR
jgi:uncharacterized protein